MAAMGLTPDILRQEVRESLRIESLLSKNLGDVKKPTKEEIDAFYKEHAKEFQTPERVHASHILVATKPDDSAEVKAQKRQQLAQMQDEVKKGGDFAQLARDHSDCPSKSQGGDLGYFERGKMVKAFDDVAFQMKPGEVSDIVETQFGYHLIKVSEHQQAGTVTREQADKDISGFLEQQNRQKAVEGYLQKLRGTAKIEYAAGAQPQPIQMPPPPQQ
jgi:peptidyl-prolyl cis-trans isomerase C